VRRGGKKKGEEERGVRSEGLIVWLATKKKGGEKKNVEVAPLALAGARCEGM